MTRGSLEAGEVRSGRLNCCVWLAAACLLPALSPSRLTAQENPVLRSALSLAAEGRGDSARRLVARELARLPPGTSAYAELLFFRARLTTSGDSAERDLRRVAIEYSNSPWADDALLQLSQLALAAANPAGSLQLAQRLRSDYPGSELRSRAALWASRAAFDVGEVRTACAYLDTAGVEGAGDIEFLNQVAFYRARCAASAVRPEGPPREVPVARDSGAAQARALPSAGVPGSELPRWLVQAAAVRSEREATAIQQRLERAGLRARVDNGPDGYRRVRVGPFATREAAAGARRQVQGLLGGDPFIVREP